MDEDKSKIPSSKEKLWRKLFPVPKTEKNQDAFVGELKALLQTYGYSITEEEAKTFQSTCALLQKKDTDDQNMPQKKSDWISSPHSLEDLQRIILESLDSIMIIMSTDGLIVSVAENISPLLGYSPEEIRGKKFISLLPEEEKRDVYRKLSLKFPVSSLVGNHNTFCCHLRRGCVNPGDKPTYEYVKVILGIKDLTDGPTAFLKSCFPKESYNPSLAMFLPLEDRFYMVGTICVLRSEILQELPDIKETSKEGDIVVIEDSDEECSPKGYRVAQGQTSSKKQSSPAKPAKDPDDEVEFLGYVQYASQKRTPVVKPRVRIPGMKPRVRIPVKRPPKHIPVIKPRRRIPVIISQERRSVIILDSDTSSEASIPAIRSPGVSPLQKLHRRLRMNYVDKAVKVKEIIHEEKEEDKVCEGEKEDKDQMEEMEEADKMEGEGKEKEEDRVREEEEDKKDQIEEMEEDKVEQMYTIEEVLPESPSSSTLPPDYSDELWHIPLAFRSYIRKREEELTERFRKLEEEHAQKLHLDFHIQRDDMDMTRGQLETLQDSKTKELIPLLGHTESPKRKPLESVFKKTGSDTRNMKILVPDLSVTRFFSRPNSSEPVEFPTVIKKPWDNSLSQSIFERLQPSFEPQFPDYSQDENLGDQKDERHCVCPENEHVSSRSPLAPALAQSPADDTSSTISYPSFTSEFSEVKMDILDDYVEMWQQSLTPQPQLDPAVHSWQPNEQASMQEQATYLQQVPAPDAGSQEPSGPQAFQDPTEYSPEQVSHFVFPDKL